METEDEGWVTDPKALDTVCALQAIQPGDLVKVEGRPETVKGGVKLSGLSNAPQVVVPTNPIRLGEPASWLKKPEPICFSVEGALFSRVNLVAWKPKGGGST